MRVQNAAQSAKVRACAGADPAQVRDRYRFRDAGASQTGAGHVAAAPAQCPADHRHGQGPLRRDPQENSDQQGLAGDRHTQARSAPSAAASVLPAPVVAWNTRARHRMLPPLFDATTLTPPL